MIYFIIVLLFIPNLTLFLMCKNIIQNRKQKNPVCKEYIKDLDYLEYKYNPFEHCIKTKYSLYPLILIFITILTILIDYVVIKNYLNSNTVFNFINNLF